MAERAMKAVKKLDHESVIAVRLDSRSRFKVQQFNGLRRFSCVGLDDKVTNIG